MAGWTIRELIDELEELAEEHGDDCEVRIAHQPSWPFEYGIGEVVADVSEDDEEEPGSAIVYIAEKDQIGYLPGTACKLLGWR